jgi:hypothetical protein
VPLVPAVPEIVTVSLKVSPGATTVALICVTAWGS